MPSFLIPSLMPEFKPPPYLPEEVYYRIIQFVSRQDLLVLSHVSSTFYHIATWILYESVDLAYNHLRIYSWFRMISLSPHLAHLVQSLTFGFVYSHIPTPSRPWLEVIARGLRSLTNLKELNLNKMGSGFITPFFAGILDNTSFQLKTFRNRMFDLEPTISFLTLQPSIKTWDNLDATPCFHDPAPLPLLSDATIPSFLLPIYHSRNITRLQTSIQYEVPAEEYHTVNNLVAYGRTLKILVLERGVIDGCSKLGDFVALIGGKLPLLEIFYLWHHGELETDSSVDAVVDSFSSFPRLTTLSILPPRCAAPDSLYMNAPHLDDASRIASFFLQRISTLTRVAFPSQYPDHENSWYAKSREVAKDGDKVIG